MYRHDLRFVLRFGVHAEFEEFARRLHEGETASGWTPPRVWHAVSGHVNQLVFEHDYADEETYRRERASFRGNPGEVGEVLAAISQLAVPGTAVQSELVGVTFPPS
jgi:hypothetical protein